MKYLYRVAVASGLEYECIADAALGVRRDDYVVVRCDRYQDFARVVACATEESVDVAALERSRDEAARGRHVEGQHVPEIARRATPQDEERAAENEERARTMHQKARERIAAHRLDMKLIDTHCSFDRRLAVFQFSAEGRVDFRELLRDLSQEFHMRVELRQVGVRDEAAIQGGIGPCGRAFCCASFLKRFNSINVKMAKIQGLSLNPANISGACGRLKCCLEYEVEHYRELYEAAKARAKSETATTASPPPAGSANRGRRTPATAVQPGPDPATRDTDAAADDPAESSPAETGVPASASAAAPASDPSAPPPGDSERAAAAAPSDSQGGTQA